MWVALPLCLLSALLATGSTLQCKVCASREQSCSGPLQPCAPSEGTCVTVVAETRLVPTVSSVPNGRQCPSFFSVGPHHWNKKELLACSGAEDHCVEESGILTVGDIELLKIAAGCGSPGACVKRVGENKYAQGLVEMLNQAECYPAPRAGGDIGEP
ncbi:unnamed protein product [Natator depressus]